MDTNDTSPQLSGTATAFEGRGNMSKQDINTRAQQKLGEQGKAQKEALCTKLKIQRVKRKKNNTFKARLPN